MGIKIKKRTLLTPKKIGLALVVVVFSSIIAYKQVIIPKKYSEYMELGKKNIVEGNYRQAIRNFEEVLIMDNDNIDAMLGLSKSYVGINDRKKVKEYVIKAQSLDMGNEDLVLQILDIIPENYRETSIIVIENYLDEVGYENVSERFQLTVLQMTNKDELNEYIKKAEAIYKKVNTKNSDKELHKYKKVLSLYIKKSKEIEQGYFYTQEEVDRMTEVLKSTVMQYDEA